MCLSAVYEIKDGNERLVSEHVSAIKLEDDLVTLTDIMGEETVIKGSMKSIDLVKNIIKIDA